MKAIRGAKRRIDLQDCLSRLLLRSTVESISELTEMAFSSPPTMEHTGTR